MEELEFHKEIEDKLNKLVGMYKDDPLLNGDFREKIINIKTSNNPSGDDVLPNVHRNVADSTSANKNNLYIATDVSSFINKTPYSNWQPSQIPSTLDPLIFNYPPSTPLQIPRMDPPYTASSQFQTDHQAAPPSFMHPNYYPPSSSSYPAFMSPQQTLITSTTYPMPFSSFNNTKQDFTNPFVSPVNNYTNKSPLLTSVNIPPQPNFKFSSTSMPDLNANANNTVSGYYSDNNSNMKASPSLYNYTESYSNPTKDKHVTYENNLSIYPNDNPSRDGLVDNLLNIDQSLTFRKVSSAGISNQLSQQISFLLHELKRLKDLNARLLDQLNAYKIELNETKNRLIITENQLQATSRTGRLAGLVEDIYRSQKVRDMAVIDRLKVANQERDSALMRASYLQQRLSGGNDIISDMVRSQSLDNLKQSTDRFVQLVKSEKEKRRAANEQEVEAILFERDLIHRQKNDLEYENRKLSNQLRDEMMRKKDIILKQKQTEKERDDCMNKLSQLHDELKSLKVCYNLHGSLSKEKDLHQQYNTLLDKTQDELQNKSKQVRLLTQDKEELLGKLKGMVSDNKGLREKCSDVEGQLLREREQTDQLTRLVAVLRRKLADA